MKVDFIHIGLHKTASTFLQLEFFPNVEGLRLLNKYESDLFYKEFVNKNEYEFDETDFLNKFNDALLYNSRERNIFAISEENISGNIYTGCMSKIMAQRLKKCFKGAHILIVIRNQLDYILSSYSNYVIHGGSKSIKQWIYGQETDFGLILKKVQYSHIVLEYIRLFGSDKVTVIPYEVLFDEKVGMSHFLLKFDLHCNAQYKSKKINSGRSILSNRVMSFLNIFGLYNIRGIQRVFKYFPGGSTLDRRYLTRLLMNDIKLFEEDNKLIENLLNIKLPDLYWPTNNSNHDYENKKRTL